MAPTEAPYSLTEKIVVTHHMFQRMGIDGDDPNGSSPLMVLFVVVLVKAGMVEESEKKHRER